MSLVDDIAAAALSPSLVRTFVRGLSLVAGVDGAIDEAEQAEIKLLMSGQLAEEARREPLEALWAHAELFIRACIHISLVDGNYSVEKSRAVSHLAHRLGISAHKLGELEESVFKDKS